MNQPKNEEMDLGSIFLGIKKGVLSSFNLILDSLSLMRKRWILFSIFISLGIGSGIALFMYSQPVYISSLTLSSNILSNDYCADIVNNLGLIVKDNTPQLLANKLEIDVSSARQIKKIEFANYNEKMLKKYENEDTIVLGIPFKVIIHASTNTVFDTMQVALVKFLENNKYALKRKVIRKDNIELLRNKLNSEMNQLDSLKKTVSDNILPRGTTPSGFVFGEPIDPISIYKAGIDLFRDDLSLRKDLELIDGIQVVDGFSPRDRPDSPRIWKTTGFCLTIFLLIAFLIAFRLERKRT